MSKFRLYTLLSASAFMMVVGFFQVSSSATIDTKFMPEFVEVKTSSGKTLAVGRYEITVQQWHECVSAKACEASVKLTQAIKTILSLMSAGLMFKII